MARARMIAPTIGTDRQLRQLSCMGARFLYGWMIPHGDNRGRLRGDPGYVRQLAIPNEPGVTDENVGQWLGEMREVGLIEWYEVDGNLYVQFSDRSWSKHQDLKKYRPVSSYPDPPQSAASRRDPPQNPARSRSEVEVEVKQSEEEVEVEVEEPKIEGAAASEQALTGSLSAPRGHPAECTCEFCWAAMLERRRVKA